MMNKNINSNNNNNKEDTDNERREIHRRASSDRRISVRFEDSLGRRTGVERRLTAASKQT